MIRSYPVGSAAGLLIRQGNDVGTGYRSVIYVSTPEQEQAARTFIDELKQSNSQGGPVVTEVKMLEAFYPAEEYHRDYYATHTTAPYCQVVINPKLEKVQKKFAKLLHTHQQSS